MFYVNVPVLSVQINVAPPIISQEESYLTKLFSSFILFTLQANDILTAKGSPSGIATTIIVTAVMKDFRISQTVPKHKKQCLLRYMSIAKFKSKAPIVRAAATVPISPIFILNVLVINIFKIEITYLLCYCFKLLLQWCRRLIFLQFFSQLALLGIFTNTQNQHFTTSIHYPRTTN